MTTTSEFAIVAAAGLVGGFINAAAGGGSLILYPALVGIGLPSVAANVTNSVALWPGYLGNILGLGTQVNASRSILVRLLVPAVVGAVLGCALLLSTPSRAFDLIVPFLIVLASMLLAFAPRLKQVLAGGAADHPRTLILAVTLASVYGGYFGGGVGVILLAVLGLTLSAGIRLANAVKGALSFILNTVSVLVFAVFGPVHVLIALVVAPAALVGGLLGARLTARLDEDLLRRLVVVFGLTIGVWLALKAFKAF